MSNFHFSKIVSESEVFKKHVHSIMLWFCFFLEIFDCILFFIILMINYLGGFFCLHNIENMEAQKSLKIPGKVSTFFVAHPDITLSNCDIIVLQRRICLLFLHQSCSGVVRLKLSMVWWACYYFRISLFFEWVVFQFLMPITGMSYLNHLYELLILSHPMDFFLAPV